MNRRRWLCLTGLCLGLAVPAVLAPAAFGQEAAPRVIEVRIENRRVVEPAEPIRATQGETIELRWTGDEAAELHLHGYDIEIEIAPGEPAGMVVEAYASGRFPISSHRWSDGGHGHDALIFLEVYPE